MTRRAMLRAVLGYVAAGWTISASDMIGEPPKDHPASGLTPVNPNWRRRLVTTSREASHRWGAHAPFAPGIVLVCGHNVDVWGVSDAVGARAVDLLPEAIERDLPVAVAPTGAWHFFTSPVAIEDLPTVRSSPAITHFGTGSYLPLPPSSQGPLGLYLWLNPPTKSFTKQHWKPVHAALTEAAEVEEMSRTEASGG
jgi:Bifunctional DNA primase/polymerase, N-terminal